MKSLPVKAQSQQSIFIDSEQTQRFWYISKNNLKKQLIIRRISFSREAVSVFTMFVDLAWLRWLESALHLS